MKHRSLLLLLPLLLLLAGGAPAKSPFVGKFAVDLGKWRAQALHDHPTMTVNGARAPITPKQQNQWLDAFAHLLGSATLEIKANGTYKMATPIFVVEGTWVQNKQRLIATPKRTRVLVSGPISVKSSPFSLERRDAEVWYMPDGSPRQQLPLRSLR
jgi:hypothetical protein